MWNFLYSQNMRNSGRIVPHEGRLPNATTSARCRSTLCGAIIYVDLVISKNQIVDFAQEIDACILGRSAAAVLGQHIIGSSLEELKTIQAQMHHLLSTGEKPHFKEKWRDLAAFEAVYPYPLRHSAVLLPFDAVRQAIDKYTECLKTDA